MVVMTVWSHQCFCAGADSPAYQLQPCTVLKQQHGKAVALVKLTPTDIMTAGTDCRICRYHWRPNSPQLDSDISKNKDRLSSATAKHSLPAAHQCSATISSYDSPCAASDSSGGSEGSERQGHGQSKGDSSGQSNGQFSGQSNEQSNGDNNGQNNGQSNKQSSGQSSGQSNGQSNGQASHKGREASSGQSMSLVCVAEERLPNITTVQDIVQVPGTKEQLVCGFQVLL